MAISAPLTSCYAVTYLRYISRYLVIVQLVSSPTIYGSGHLVGLYSAESPYVIRWVSMWMLVCHWHEHVCHAADQRLHAMARRGSVCLV